MQMGKRNKSGGGRYRGRNSGGGGGGNNSGGGGGGNRGGNYRQNRGNRRRGGGAAVADNRRDQNFPEDSNPLPLIPGSGVLEMHPNGYGFLRDPSTNFTRERSDPFVPGTMIEKYGLREGLLLHGMVQRHRKGQGPRLKELLDVDGLTPEDYNTERKFENLTPITPEQWFQLETGPEPLSTRVIDLLAPLGRGQRALIVAPPRTGKTVLLQHLSHGISQNYPEVALMVLLIDERPEEVTDMRRTINGEVFASSLDQDVDSHVRLSQLTIERCKRLAEMGKDVFLLMDSITRLARAFNKWVGNTGRTMSGGVDIKAMDIPKKLFASARAFEEGGSLTIVGTAPDRHRQPYGRPDFSGIQRDRQYGTGARPQTGRPSRLALDRYRTIRHPPRRTPAATRDAPRRNDAPPHAIEHAPHRRHGATHQ